MFVFYTILFITSLGLTYLVRQVALKKNIIDNPNERSSHTIPTPRGGGLAIVVTWFVGLTVLFVWHKLEPALFYALLSGLILALVSFLDDIFDIKPAFRMAAQALAALGALYFLGGIKLFPSINSVSLFWLMNGVVFIGIVWFINLYNFLDGLDGYASQEAIVVALGMFMLTKNPMLLLLVASVAGFLVWNWPKAKIFMGDVGSTQLGFILVVFGIWFHNQTELSIANWLILTALFWFDATLTLFRRWRNGEQLSVAHKKHAYQRLVQGGFSHLKVDLLAIGINLFLVLVVAINHFMIQKGILFLLAIVAFLFYVNKRVDNIFAFKKD